MSTGGQPPVTAGKVPVWRTAIGSYSFVFSNLGRFFALGWLLLVIAFAASSLNGIVTEATTGESRSLAEWVTYIAFNAVYWAVYVVFAVRWHRFFLLGERESMFTDVLGARNWRFLGYTVLLSFASYIPLLIAYLLSGELPLFTVESQGAETNVLVVLLFTGLLSIIAMIIGIVLMRFSLVLPGTAVDRPLGLGEAWRNMRGNTWRFIGAMFLVAIPLIIAALSVGTFVGLSDFASKTGSEFEISVNVLVLANGATAVISFLTVAAWVTGLSKFYCHIVGGESGEGGAATANP